MIDLSKYFNRILELDPRQEHGLVEPGRGSRPAPEAAEQHHLTFAPDPRRTSLHPGRHDRQQLLRRPTRSMGGKTTENTEELEVLTYDGLRMRVGKTSNDELDRIIGGGRPPWRRFIVSSTRCDKYADLIRERYPKIPRRVSGYNLLELLPEHGFDVAEALVGTEGTCVTVS